MDNDFVTVGKASAVPVGGLAAFDVSGTRVAVANIGGAFHAFDDTCSHEYCSLAEGDLEGQAIVCPCHFGKFDVTTGAVLEPPPFEPIRTFRVRVQGDDLQIAL